jgi:hypothetical protein
MTDCLLLPFIARLSLAEAAERRYRVNSPSLLPLLLLLLTVLSL